MAGTSVEAGSNLAGQIQSAVQPKLMENGWVAEENDTTLSEYVTMMIVNGKDLQSVRSELGGDLLGVGEDDAAVGEFAQWLFEFVNSLAVPQQAPAQQEEQPQAAPIVQDAQMEDTAASTEAVPTGPKSMRNGNSTPRGGRGGRLLGQMNRNMDRSNDLPDNLRKIRGAAGGQTGRINSHAGRDGAPRGPRGASNAARGIQLAMNGGRGAHHNNMNAMGGGMGFGMPNGQMDPQQQMQLMQMMEMQANMLAQVMQNNGQMSPMSRGGFQQQRGRGRGNARGRGDRQQTSSELHAVDGKMPMGALTDSKPAHADGMEIDGEDQSNSKFSVMCKFNHNCSNPGCGFAHSTPASTTPISVDLSETCTFGSACKNFKCHARHPSPAQAHGGGGGGGGGIKAVCKFYPNCTNPNCMFEHPAGAACRNGADCTVPGCKFTHTTIVCKYNPCSRPTCPFKHADGQKRGNFQDKVWTADGVDGANGNGKADRFADFNKQSEGAAEELILPGQQAVEANGNGFKQEEAIKQEQSEGIVT
ncbi:uncharacterized protein MYCGRDRAFT_100443 [Zymoseptoria tritici IPO323]|uniref:Nab2-like CCCH zinc finger domain-containing protein n=1 Tax=Zymoseptoria tritici (strain CBS 115943 / IPO323) TaxID=336722 RepID=F9XCX1_ZYMTI|nr:uncharacterized protein MYCGRDRAFT_100443 [Zymoseptoria tritici IPO323]EGP86896.1 hypothetical protein MYCGRDRAFT_100443 [Zymoseptoria tritici IPO323]